MRYIGVWTEIKERTIFKFILYYFIDGASEMALVVKNPPANAGDLRDKGSIRESGRSPRGRCGNSLQDSPLGNTMDRGAWQATIYRLAQSQIQLKQLSTDRHYR